LECVSHLQLHLAVLLNRREHLLIRFLISLFLGGGHRTHRRHVKIALNVEEIDIESTFVPPVEILVLAWARIWLDLLVLLFKPRLVPKVVRFFLGNGTGV
jgi:hypothetical protein